MTKVLIVDDERNIREGIKSFIDWEALDCEVVSLSTNGEIALKYIEKNPVDIVVTDIKMPVMDGLELSRRIAEEFSFIRVVILTAYSDFEMARTAIRHGVEDFIIKNDFMEELPKTVKRLVDEIKAKKSTKLDDARNVFDAMRLKNKKYCLVACEIEKLDENCNVSLEKLVNNILAIALKNCEFYVDAVNENYLNIVVAYDKKSFITLKNIIEDFNNILIMVEEFMRINLRVGISSEADDYKKYETLMDEAKSALSRCVDQESDVKVYMNGLEIGGDYGLIDVDNFSLRLGEVIFDNSEDEAYMLLDEFSIAILENQISFEQAKLYALILYSAMIHKAVNYHIDVDEDFNDLEREIYLKIQESKTMYMLISLGKELIARLRNLCVGKIQVKNELVKKVDECIRNHYMEDINLNYISTNLYMNNSYVSRAYKKLTGLTVTEKINQYRISKAKELLRGSNLKIYEIADEVGFKDPAYFTNVFIKLCDKNPSEYRSENIKAI